jgi:hypothetical protein
MPDGSIGRRSVITVALLGLTGCFGESTAVISPEPRVQFIEPADGATVPSPVRVRFEVTGRYQVRPAGDMSPNTGHLHLIIDSGPVAAGMQIPFDPNHLHYGTAPVPPAMVDTMVELPPGTHTLTVQFADGAHRAYGGWLIQTIQVVTTVPPIG